MGREQSRRERPWSSFALPDFHKHNYVSVWISQFPIFIFITFSVWYGTGEGGTTVSDVVVLIWGVKESLALLPGSFKHGQHGQVARKPAKNMPGLISEFCYQSVVYLFRLVWHG